MKSGIFTSDILHHPSYIRHLTSDILHQPSALIYFSGTPCVFFTSFITNTLWK